MDNTDYQNQDDTAENDDPVQMLWVMMNDWLCMVILSQKLG